MPYVLLGLSLGLGAGLAPGPLLALVVQRTLRYGVVSGIRIAVVPLLTDLPIVILAILVVSHLSEIYLHAMMFLGGVFVLWLAFESWRETGEAVMMGDEAPTAQQDFLRGMVVNFLNPHPYLFWGAVGAPIVIQAGNRNVKYAAGFVIAFYFLLVGSKVVLSIVLEWFRRAPSSLYHRLMQFSSLLLLAAGGYMIYSAWQGVALLR